MKNKPYGITGSIASGKSIFTDYLIKKNYKVIDSDLISHKITQKNQKGYLEIIKHFGNEVLNNDKNLNRKKISSIVFSNKEKLKLLNSILHPIIIFEIEKEIDNYNKISSKIFFLDVPLLFEVGLEYLCKKIILVYTDEKTQIDRLISRDNLDLSEAQKIISSQMSLDEKMKKADIIIENNSSIEDLYKKIDKLLLELESK